MSLKLQLGHRSIGPDYPPLVIAEIGINHEGNFQKAIRMVDDAHAAGCECVKFQCHVIEDEMIPNDVVPGNAIESIWDIMARCALTEEEEYRLEGVRRSEGYVLSLYSLFSCCRRASGENGCPGLQNRFWRMQ